MREKIKNFIKKEIVLCISAAVAVISMIAVPPDFMYTSYIDAKTIALLFCLMLSVAGFTSIGLFAHLGKRLSSKANTTKMLAAILVSLCFFSSMAITNDVALLTFVPFTIFVLNMSGASGSTIHVVVLETIAANLGSMATPIGNPQNIYIYSSFGIDASSFIKIMFPLTAVSFVLLIIFTLIFTKNTEHGIRENEKKQNISANTDGEKSDSNFSFGLKGVAYSVTFVLCILCVAKILPYHIMTVLVCVAVFFVDKKIFLKADYALLATFVCFFIFVGNLQRIEQISTAIEKIMAGREFPVAIITSQIISNVPAAVLLSGFVDDFLPLLYGTNIGGLGTPVASLASLISMKIYATSENANLKKYIVYFLLMNIIFLAILTTTAAIIIR